MTKHTFCIFFSDTLAIQETNRQM